MGDGSPVANHRLAPYAEPRQPSSTTQPQQGQRHATGNLDQPRDSIRDVYTGGSAIWNLASTRSAFEPFPTASRDTLSNAALHSSVEETLINAANLTDFNHVSADFQYASDLTEYTGSAFPQQEIGAFAFTGNMPPHQTGLQQLDIGQFLDMSGTNQMVQTDMDASKSHPTLSSGAPSGTRRPRTGKASQEGGNRIQCDQPGCSATFGRGAEFRRHLSTKHRRGQTAQVRCMVCPYEYPRLDKVRLHMEKMHGLLVEKKREAHLTDAHYAEL